MRSSTTSQPARRVSALRTRVPLPANSTRRSHTRPTVHLNDIAWKAVLAGTNGDPIVAVERVALKLVARQYVRPAQEVLAAPLSADREGIGWNTPSQANR